MAEDPVRERTTVVVVGAGAAGLTTATLLQRSGIGCIVLESRSRESVEHRQRAGVVEYRAVAMFQRWGLADELLGHAPPDDVMELRVDGTRHLVDLSDPTASDGRAVAGRLCPQQLLIRRLITGYSNVGDLHFEIADVTLSGLTEPRPLVGYSDASGVRHEIECAYIAGCDGDHGVSRGSIPGSAITTTAFDHGITWLSVLAETAPPEHPLMAVSTEGVAAQFLRGPASSRFYLECEPGTGPQEWPPERIWQALRSRLADPRLPTGPITQVEAFDFRTLVHEPMSYGNLYLLGDAAHLLPPMGGKGMNLALYDADVFARAVVDAVRSGDGTGLRDYSDTCLRRAWNYTEFSHWMSEMVHDSGDQRRSGPLRHRLARARLDRLLRSQAQCHAFAELMRGTA